MLSRSDKSIVSFWLVRNVCILVGTNQRTRRARVRHNPPCTLGSSTDPSPSIVDCSVLMASTVPTSEIVFEVVGSEKK